MDKQQIRRQLSLIAQEEIPDTMNLLPRIQGELKRKAKPERFGWMRLANATTVFVLMLMLGGMGFAAYYATMRENAAPSDPQAYPINLNQTIDGVTMTLNWVYADANRVTIQYTVSYNQNLVSLSDNYTIRLDSADGAISLPLEPIGGGSRGGGGDGFVVLMNTVNFDASHANFSGDMIDLRFVVAYSDGSRQIQATAFPPTVVPPMNMTATPVAYGLDPFMLTATAIVNEATVAANQFLPTVPPPADISATPVPYGLDPFMLTATAIVNEATAAANQFLPTVPPPFAMTATPIPMNSMIEPSLIPPVEFMPTSRSFVFEMRVPFHALRSVNSVNGSSEVHLQNLRVADSVTRFELCYAAPDGQIWYPQVSAESAAPIQPYQQGIAHLMGIDGQFDYGAMQSAPSQNANGEICVPMMLTVPLGESQKDLLLTVDYLYREANLDDMSFWEREGVFFSLRGFDTAMSFGNGDSFPNPAENDVLFRQANGLSVLYTVNRYPSALTLEEAKEYIQNHWLHERYEGNWQFEISLK